MPDEQPIASVTLNTTSSGGSEDMQWSPEPGPELDALLSTKLEGKPLAQAQVTAAACAILGRGVPPGVQAQDTGLVVGYVQSGKTLSFTAVMALARDNGFQLIIVIAGSSTQLVNQSFTRIKGDLQMDTAGRRAWAPYPPNPKPVEAHGIEGLLDAWRDPRVRSEQRQTVVITVMKQHTHLRNLTRLLGALDLSGISALIIDDEADQASLNIQAQQSVRKGRPLESTTYRRLMALRRALPSHTFLQYTATPQAPLLISIIDSLSARWVEVLEPGGGYTGGVTFFGPARVPGEAPPPRPSQHSAIVRIIPAAETQSSTNAVVAAPPSLQSALRMFMVGVAAAYALGETVGENRSMLVHPSIYTDDHRTYLNWINDLLQAWNTTFRRGEGDASAMALAETFRSAYDDIATTVGAAMPTFDAVRTQFRQAFNNTVTKEVNRRQGAPVIIQWQQRYAWILVGGAAMDRGFTVEGLTVTYMPRGIGGGNADTMQQRARFFGYKAGYLGYCRVFLERDAKQAFEDYVDHEEFMRGDLVAVRDAGQPLQQWPRRFVLDPTLKPCRDNVLRDPYSRSMSASEEWMTPQAYIGGSGAEQFNQEVVQRFVRGHSLHEDDGHPDRTDIQRHLVTDPMPLIEVANDLLADFRVRDPGEAEKWASLKALLGRMLDENGASRAVVYVMSGKFTRKRGINLTGRVKQFFQGESNATRIHQQGEVYPGDRKIACPGAVTIQVHLLDLTNDADEVIARGVPFLAVLLPEGGLRPMVMQEQPVQAASRGRQAD